jgi:hypothetical protein
MDYSSEKPRYSLDARASYWQFVTSTSTTKQPLVRTHRSNKPPSPQTFMCPPTINPSSHIRTSLVWGNTTTEQGRSGGFRPTTLDLAREWNNEEHQKRASSRPGLGVGRASMSLLAPVYCNIAEPTPHRWRNAVDRVINITSFTQNLEFQILQRRPGLRS